MMSGRGVLQYAHRIRGRHSSFVFPHLENGDWLLFWFKKVPVPFSKVCPTFNNKIKLFSKKKDFLNLCRIPNIIRKIFHLNIFYISIILNKFHIITCMKVIGEIFLFKKREKKPKRQDTKSIQTFRQKDCYRTELWPALS